MDLQAKIDNLKSDRNDYIASAGRYWQEDEGVQKWLVLVDQEISRLEKLQSILSGAYNKRSMFNPKCNVSE